MAWINPVRRTDQCNAPSEAHRTDADQLGARPVAVITDVPRPSVLIDDRRLCRGRVTELQ